MGPDVVEYVAVCDFIILGELVPMNKKSGISDLIVSNTLEEAVNIVGHGLTTLGFLALS